MSSMYPSASRVAEAIAVASDPRSWACILPAGECSSARLVATAVQFACVDARSGSSTNLGEARAGFCSCSSVKRGLPRVLVPEAEHHPLVPRVSVCERATEPH
jgi:hypothetical protein